MRWICCFSRGNRPGPEPEPIYPHAAEGILYRADFLCEQKRYSESLTCYRQGLEILQSFIEAAIEPRKSYLLNERMKYSEKAEHVRELMNKNNAENRTMPVKKEETVDSHSAEGFFHRADFLLKNNRISEALICYQQGLELLEPIVDHSPESTKNYLLHQMALYSDKMEQIKAIWYKEKSVQIDIAENSAPESNERRHSTLAEGILLRADYLYQRRRLSDAVMFYRQGLEVLESSIEGSDLSTEDHLLAQIAKYTEKVDQVETIRRNKKEATRHGLHEQIAIGEDSIGNSYEALIGKFLDPEVTYVVVEDPYIRKFPQCQNFLKLCELLVKSCKNLEIVKLVTSHEDGPEADAINIEQNKSLAMIQNDLLNYDVKLKVEFSSSLHDRQIILSNGYIIKIGRGLGIYKAPANKFSIGNHDMNYRRCYRTNVDIIFRKDITRSVQL